MRRAIFNINEKEENDVTSSVFPKRVLAFSSEKLIRQLSRNLKSSVDGTFKSSCTLWRQLFIWMVKDNGYWFPVVFGWLPDKSEISYKVFFLMVKQKLKEFGLELKVKSILCDYELNIMKSIDMFLELDIDGCFFHHKKCFQSRVDKKGMKTRYESDEHFRNFINQTSAISFLPVSDVQEGLDYIEQEFVFDDNRGKDFKADFLKYIQDFWIDGPIPMHIWNVFGRSSDLTNNNQVSTAFIS